jgi:hypothetical protein
MGQAAGGEAPGEPVAYGMPAAPPNGMDASTGALAGSFNEFDTAPGAAVPASPPRGDA